MNRESIDTLVDEVLNIEREEAYRAGAIGYMSRALIQATMPYRKPENNEFKRQNGAFKLTMLADSEIGLPYGSIPRLLISWITTEAVKTKSRELILGSTLSEFMSELDMIPSGGKWGSITRLKDQMKRLFSSSISCTYDDGKNWGVQNVSPVERAELWWDPKNPNNASKWESKLVLGESFFKEVIGSPVPIDMRALKILRQSPMAIDIYCWLTYRMSYLRRITPIPWNVLQMQFGANYKDLRQFKSKFISHLKKVLFVYPDAKVKEDNGKLVLFPGRSHISKREVTTQKNMTKRLEIKPDLEKSSMKEIEIQDKYKEYKVNLIIDIIEKLPDENERHKILKEFDYYLTRKGMKKIRNEVINGNHTFLVKEELYNFVNSHWNHLLDEIKPYTEFCKGVI